MRVIMKNLEIKCRMNTFTLVRRALKALGAVRQVPVLKQVDWYFPVPRGRFKLRQVRGGAGELIFYIRPTTRAARVSDFSRLPVPDVPATRRLLADALGEAACVSKRRELWLLENARIHLDQVDRLGRFLEVEVIVTQGIGQAKTLMRTLLTGLAIEPDTLVAQSYAELVARASAR